MKKTTIILMIILLVSACSSATTTETENVTLFETPDEAIIYFFDGMRELSYNKMIEASDVKKVAKNYQFDLDSENERMPTIVQGLFPSNGDFIQLINEETLRSSFHNDICHLLICFLATEYAFEYDFSNELSDDIEMLSDTINEERLSELTIVDMYIVTDLNDRLMDTLKENYRAYGVDETEEMLVIVEVDKQTFAVPVLLSKIDGTYGIRGFSDGFIKMALGMSFPAMPYDETVEELIEDGTNSFHLTKFEGK